VEDVMRTVAKGAARPVHYTDFTHYMTACLRVAAVEDTHFVLSAMANTLAFSTMLTILATMMRQVCSRKPPLVTDLSLDDH
jgi:hypothetical protein